MSPTREEASMFFHADDARSQTSLPPSRPTLRKEPSFFYANGAKEDQSSRSASKSPPPISPPLPALGTMRSQFFHADGTSGMAIYQSPPLASPPLSDTHSMVHPSTSAPTLRPSSPSKDSIHLSYRKGASQVIRPNSILPPREGKDVKTPRRASVEMNSSLFGHGKTTSLSSITSASIDSGSRRSSLVAGATSQPSQKSLNINTATRTMSPTSLASPPTLAADAHAISSTPVSTPLSPSKAVSNAANQFTELAANARRERKVMDLEISNNSLLAINRQLEKQLRSQKAELRRYRRLTRAGRLSMAPSELDDMFHSEDEAYLDSEDEDGQNDSSFLSDDNSDSDESALSPSALAEHDSRKIAKDEKRLRLDLSKHRQLLVDSQKMNQSLRRCLGWTEELINEGKKALSYNVRVSDVKLGGRVLRRDEDLEESFEEHLEEQHGPVAEEEEMENDEEHEDEQQHEVGDVLGLMSPWMRLGASRNSREGTPSPAGESGGFFGLGIQAGAGPDSLRTGQPDPAA